MTVDLAVHAAYWLVLGWWFVSLARALRDRNRLRLWAAAADHPQAFEFRFGRIDSVNFLRHALARFFFRSPWQLYGAVVVIAAEEWAR